MRMITMLGCVFAVSAFAEDRVFWKTNANGSVTIDDPNLGFKLVLPKGSEAAQSLPEGFAYLFAVPSGDTQLTVGVQKLKAKQPRNFTKADAAKVGRLPAGVSLSTEFQWTGLDLMVMRNEQKAGEALMVDYGAQIPSSGRASFST